eukprot:TRINITY_DN12553_c0_g1_i1.p1 TRINITY_DN12553_c0_g1~~TRINITY_DN12553_c0_g1_i1.p1  ORF type:complete len:366 (+),score=52.80 TRINITY_DN12553_c0_g1_i1:121-1218(+)
MAPKVTEDNFWIRRLLAGGVTGAALLGTAWYVLRRLLKTDFLRALRRSSQVRIAGLYVYPVKSCCGHLVEQVEVTPWGLKNDRLYMIVDGKSNRFFTQREEPRMALLDPDLPTADGIILKILDSAAKATVVQNLFVPLVKDSETVRKVIVWDDIVPAVDQGDEVARWLSTFLGRADLRLVRIADSAQRATDTTYGPGETAFADGFPILVTSTASVDDLARRVKRQGGPDIGINRFRTNLHIEGCQAWDEDEMRAITFSSPASANNATHGSSRLRMPLVKPCARCTIPGVDPSTGVRSVSTGGTLTKIMRQLRPGTLLRSRAQLHQGHFSKAENDDEVFFGQNAQVHFNGEPSFILSIGDIGTVEW